MPLDVSAVRSLPHKQDSNMRVSVQAVPVELEWNGLRTHVMRMSDKQRRW